MSKSRKNHYVPKWYQKGFCIDTPRQLHYLDLSPKQIQLPDGSLVSTGKVKLRPVSKCFVQKDLYTTFFGEVVNDEIERMLFGRIDNAGAKAVRAFPCNDPHIRQEHFFDFFHYINAQMIRTPKGLSWLKSHYSDLTQSELMIEMQAIRDLHCVLWMEGVREIVSAEKSDVKFIVTDHPITVYNYACPPTNEKCEFPFDPSIKLAGTQTLFALDLNHLLILTHYEYATNPEAQNPKTDRTNALYTRRSFIQTNNLIHGRMLNDEDVLAINFVLKSRAARYLAAGREDFLYPENHVSIDWKETRNLLLPPDKDLCQFGGDVLIGYKDGTTHYQDAYGRTVPENPYLRKSCLHPNRIGKNDPCGCGSGRSYESCCQNKSEDQRPSWQQRSIRERNLALIRAVKNITGLNKGKTWDNLKRDFNEGHVKRIHEVYQSLWPPYTDIWSLLPKPDNELRALYSGITDPQLISLFVTSVAPLFDQLLIQSPFIIPASFRPEFNPTESPQKYVSQTFKNIYLLLILEPFIEVGFVNLFPDPCDFDSFLRVQVYEMAENRHIDIEPSKDDLKLFSEISKAEISRKILVLPRGAQHRYIKKTFPELSTDLVKQYLDCMEAMKYADPLALIREDMPNSEEGQLIMGNLSPNFELAMYIAQMTGSVIFTHSQTRWEELHRARRNSPNFDGPSIKLLQDAIHALEHRFSFNPILSLELRSNGSFAQVRSAIKDLVLAARPTAGLISESASHELAHNLTSGFERAYANNPSSGHLFQAKMECLLPRDGLVHKNVERILLMSGNENYLRSVSMALRMVPQDIDFNFLGL